MKFPQGNLIFVQGSLDEKEGALVNVYELETIDKRHEGEPNGLLALVYVESSLGGKQIMKPLSRKGAYALSSIEGVNGEPVKVVVIVSGRGKDSVVVNLPSTKPTLSLTLNKTDRHQGTLNTLIHLNGNSTSYFIKGNSLPFKSLDTSINICPLLTGSISDVVYQYHIESWDYNVNSMSNKTNEDNLYYIGAQLDDQFDSDVFFGRVMGRRILRSVVEVEDLSDPHISIENIEIDKKNVIWSDIKRINITVKSNHGDFYSSQTLKDARTLSSNQVRKLLGVCDTQEFDTRKVYFTIWRNDDTKVTTSTTELDFRVKHLGYKIII